MFRRTTLQSLGVVTVALTGCAGGAGDGTPTLVTDGGSESALTVTSPAFENGGRIPTEHTCDGADRSPELRITDAPDAANHLGLLVDDPDAPSANPFVHWLLYDFPADTETIPADVAQGKRVDSLDGKQGTNGFGDTGYGGPCPPKGNGPHTYRFRLFALSEPTGLEPGGSRDAFLRAVQEREVARTTLTGEYKRA